MVAIIGVLAAVAIPAYQKYQESAKVGVIKGSINQIIKAFNACITAKSAGDCDDGHIDNTLEAQPNVAIVGIAGTGTPSGACFTVKGAGSLNNYEGCVALGTNGNVIRQSVETDIKTTSTMTMCTASMTVCAN